MVDSSSPRPPLPPDDLALLAGLPPPELRAAAESRIQVYRKMIEDMNGYIFQLISIQNTTVPLHATLPPEVLFNVFRHVSPTRRADIRLTHVCKLWRDLIHRTPEFWADMLGAKAMASRLDYHESNTPLSLMTFIERSSPAPYKLNLYEDLSILIEIPSHISRIYSLSWEILEPNSLHHLEALLNLDMPRLEILRCKAYYVTVSMLRETVRRLSERGKAEFPRLRRVILYGGLACPAFAFPSLKELKIESGAVSRSFSLLLELLRGIPQLQTLELDLLLRPPLQDAPPLDDAIRLPHLRQCCIIFHANEEAWAHRILAYVHFPATAQLKIKWLDGYSGSLSRLIPVSPSNGVEALQAITICCDTDPDDQLVLRVYGYVGGSSTKQRLKLNVYDPCWRPDENILPSQALSELAMLFSNARLIRYLKIKLERGVSITQDDWFTILDAFRNLSSLIVHIDSCRNLLTVLRRDPSRWPRLRRLSISCKNGSGVHKCLLSVVENRSREGLRLKSLAFSGHGKKPPLSEHRMRRLQGLVREVTMVDELKL